jgi:hypothetical protein
MACQQTVADVVSRLTTQGTWLLCTCPHCGAVWNALPTPAPHPTVTPAEAQYLLRLLQGDVLVPASMLGQTTLAKLQILAERTSHEH